MECTGITLVLQKNGASVWTVIISRRVGTTKASGKHGDERPGVTKGGANLDQTGGLLVGVSNQRFLLTFPLVFNVNLQICPNTQQVSASLYLEGLFKT